MTTQRLPHPFFATGWAILVVAMIVSGIIGLRGNWQGWLASGTLAGIIVLELGTIFYRGRLYDTWSRITQWANRQLTKQDGVPGWLKLNPLWGWNTVITIQALAFGRLIYVVFMFHGDPGIHPYALAIGGLMAVGQLAHWLAPRWAG